MRRRTARPTAKANAKPRRRDWASAISAIRSVVVMHDVVARAPLDDLVATASCLAYGSENAVQAYGALWRTLASGHLTLREAVAGAIVTSENLLSQQAASGVDVAPAMLDAVTHDLQAIAYLVDLADHLHAAVHAATGVAVPPLPATGLADHANARRLAVPALGELSAPGGASVLATHYARHGGGHFAQARAFVWTGTREGSTLDAFDPVPAPDDVHAADLVGSFDARALLRRNTANLLRGAPANNVLLYGDRGTGKSSSVKSLLNEPDHEAWGDAIDPANDASIPWHLLRLIEVPKARLADFPTIASTLRGRPERFIVFVDDLSFEDGETQYKDLKALLDGGIAARPSNVVVYATSNRRHLIREQFSDRPDPLNTDVHGQDTVQEKLSFADRFGLTLTFTTPSQDEYVAIAAHLARRRDLPIAATDLRRRAISWAAWHNGRSGRTARQFIDDLTAELG